MHEQEEQEEQEQELYIAGSVRWHRHRRGLLRAGKGRRGRTAIATARPGAQLTSQALRGCSHFSA
jgi:hypothetical protein